MALLNRVMAVLAAAEAAYAIEPVAGNFKGVLCGSGADVSPSGDKIERDILRTTFSPMATRVGAKRVQVTLPCELRGGGLGVGGEVLPPDYEPLLLACGTQRTDVVRLAVESVVGFEIGEEITGGTSSATGVLHHIDDKVLVLRNVIGTFVAAEMVTGGESAGTASITAGGVIPGIEYRPVTARVETQGSVCLKYHKDSILHVVRGGRGTAILDCQVGKIPSLKFTMTGLWSDPAAAVLPTPELTTLTGPTFVNARATIGSYAPIMSALSLDLGNTISERVSINGMDGLMSQIITGRRSTGSIDPEVDDLAAFNPWNDWKSATPARLAATVGDTPGNRIRVEVPKGSYEDVKYGERAGLAAYQLGYVASVDRDGDDEWRVTIH